MDQANNEPRWVRLAAQLTLIVASALIFLPGLHAPFVYDDLTTVKTNPSIRTLWPLSVPLSPPSQHSVSGRPLVNLTFAVNYALGGESPAGYHLFNIALHAAVALLLFEVIVRTLRRGAHASVAVPLAAAATLLWAVHPLHSETLTYVTQRTELMMAMFYLATLLCAMRSWEVGRLRQDRLEWNGWTIAAVACCALGMMCKEVMATAPVAVLLYQRTFVTPAWRDIVRRSWPLYAGLLATWGVLALVAPGGREGSAGFGLGVAATTWWMTQAKVFFMYLKLIVWPHPLLIHYSIPYVNSLAAGLPWAAGLAALMIATAVLLWKRHPAGFVGAWVFLILSPTMVVPIITEVAAERRMYLPLAAIMALAVVGGYALLRRAGASGRAGVVVAAALAIALGMWGARRVAQFNDPALLWRQAIAHGNPNAIELNNLGAVLSGRGEHDEALRWFEGAIALDDDYLHPQYNRGVSLGRLGRDEEAVAQYRRLLAIDPTYVEAAFNLGGRLESLNRPDEAIAAYEMALRAQPDYVAARVNLGALLFARGRVGESAAHLEHALRVRPDHAVGRMNLGVAYAGLGRMEDAAAQFRRAVEADPTLVQGWVSLAMASAQLGRTADAIAAAQRGRAAAQAKGDMRAIEQLDHLFGPTQP